jgi:glucokinase
MKRKFAVGTDIGGSHISCALIDMEQEAIVKESFTTQKVDNSAPADEILTSWADALTRTICKTGKDQLSGIGFAMPGPFDYENGIAMFTHEVVKYGNLYKVDVRNQLKMMLGLDDNCDLRFINDATSFAIGEAWMGKAKGHKRSFSITLGTGFGSAFIDSGIPVVDRPDVPAQGCVWHIPYKNGIADDYFSTRWFIRRYAEKTGKKLTGVKEIAGKIREDPLAKEVFEEFGTNLGDFLGPMMKIFSVEVLVIGGNVSQAYNLFGKNLVDSLKRQNLRTQISISGLKENAAILGSARLLEDEFWQRIKPLLSLM